MRRLALLLLAAALAACDTSSPEGPTVVAVGSLGADGAGAVTLYRPATEAASTETTDGAVRGVEVWGGRLYVLLGDGRLRIEDLRADEPAREIAVGSPRGWAVVAGTAYVSNADAGTVTPVFLATGQTGPPVGVGADPAGVAAVGNRVHVALAGAGAVAVVSAENDVLVQTVDVGCERPRAALADGDGEVWVVCAGSADGARPGEVVVLDGSSGDVVARLPLGGPVEAIGQPAAASRARGELYVVLGRSVLRFDTDANALAETVEVGGDAPISAVGYDEGADRLVLGRLDPAAPLSEPGVVTVHDRTGAEVARFEAGVAPVSIAVGTE